MNSSRNSSIYISNPLADQTLFDHELKSDLDVTTFHLVLGRLNVLKKRDVTRKNGAISDEKIYSTEIARAMDLSPEYGPIKQLIISEPSTQESKRSSQTVDSFLFTLFTQDQATDEQLKEHIALYVIGERKNDESFKQRLNNAWEKNQRIKNAYFGTFRNTYAYTQIDLYEKLGSVMIAQAKIESVIERFHARSDALLEKITALEEEIHHNSIQNPTDELDGIFQAYTTLLNHHFETGKKVCLQNSINNTKIAMRKSIFHIVDDYAEKTKKLSDTIEKFPDNTSHLLEREMKNTNDNERDKKLRQLLSFYREKFKNEYTTLNASLACELRFDEKKPSPSQIISCINSFDFGNPSEADCIIGSDLAELKMENLLDQLNSARLICDAIFRKIIHYQQKTTFLHKEVALNSFWLENEGLALLSEATHRRDTLFNILCNTIKTINGTTQATLQDDEFTPLKTLQNQITKYANSVTTELNEKFPKIYQAYIEKSKPIEELIKELSSIDDKPDNDEKSSTIKKNPSHIAKKIYLALANNDNSQIEKILGEYPKKLKNRVQLYKIKMKKLQEDKFNELKKETERATSEHWKLTLSVEFKQEINQMMKEFQSKKFDTLFEIQQKNEPDFIRSFLIKYRSKEEKEQQTQINTFKTELKIATEKMETAAKLSPKIFAIEQRKALLLQERLRKSPKTVRETFITPSPIRETEKGSGLAAFLAALAAPIAMMVGSIEIYKLALAKTNSHFLSAISVFLGIITFFYSYYQGIKRIYTGQSAYDNLSDYSVEGSFSDHAPQPCPYPSVPHPTTATHAPSKPIPIRSGHVELPSTSPCSPSSPDNTGNEIKPCISPQMANVKNIKFGPHAADFMKRTLSLIKNPNDLTITNKPPFVVITIQQARGKLTQYSILPNNNNEFMVFAPASENGTSISPLLPSQFILDSDLKLLLYPEDLKQEAGNLSRSLDAPSFIPLTRSRARSASLH